MFTTFSICFRIEITKNKITFLFLFASFSFSFCFSFSFFSAPFLSFLCRVFIGGAFALAKAPPSSAITFSHSGAIRWFVRYSLGGCGSNCPATFVLFFFFFQAFNLPGGAIFERASEPTFLLFWQYLWFSTFFFIGGRVA